MRQPRKITQDFEFLDTSRQRPDFVHTDVWRVFRIMSEFVEGFELMHKAGPAVAIFGSARLKPSSPYYRAARRTAELLGKEGFSIITGGGPGIMEAANRGAQKAGAKSIGFNIELPFEQKCNSYLDVSYTFRYFFVRKMMFVKYSSAFVIFPGGFGTLDELFESLTLVQTEKIMHFPVILFGKRYWSKMIRWVRSEMVAQGCVSSAETELVHLTDEPKEVVRCIKQAVSELHGAPTELMESADGIIGNVAVTHRRSRKDVQSRSRGNYRTPRT